MQEHNDPLLLGIQWQRKCKMCLMSLLCIGGRLKRKKLRGKNEVDTKE